MFSRFTMSLDWLMRVSESAIQRQKASQNIATTLILNWVLNFRTHSNYKSHQHSRRWKTSAESSSNRQWVTITWTCTSIMTWRKTKTDSRQWCMWSRRLTIWLLRMSRLNSKPIEDSLKMFNSSTSSRRALSKISIKKMAPITMTAICPIKLSRRLAMTIRTSSMERLSPRFTKWSRKTRKMILRK